MFSFCAKSIKAHPGMLACWYAAIVAAVLRECRTPGVHVHLMGMATPAEVWHPVRPPHCRN